jgi:hypothetical protein
VPLIIHFTGAAPLTTDEGVTSILRKLTGNSRGYVEVTATDGRQYVVNAAHVVYIETVASDAPA